MWEGSGGVGGNDVNGDKNDPLARNMEGRRERERPTLRTSFRKDYKICEILNFPEFVAALFTTY